MTEERKYRWLATPMNSCGTLNALASSVDYDFPPKRVGVFDVSLPCRWPDEKDFRGQQEAWHMLILAQKKAPWCHAFKLEHRLICWRTIGRLHFRNDTNREGFGEGENSFILHP